MIRAPSAFGLVIALAAAFGGALLFVATADANARALFGVYWPGPVVVLILALFLIGMLEVGIRMTADPGYADPPRAQSPARRAVDLLFMVAFAAGLLGVVALGARWIVAAIASGFEPARETFVVGGTFGVYAVLRVVLTVARVDQGELARAVGIHPAVPDPGETLESFAARMVVGFLVGIPLFDVVIVFVGVALAPTDTRIHPAPSASTLPAAVLWFVGLASAGSLVTRYMRRNATAGQLRARAVVALATLVPALILDARVPLYPFIAGIAASLLLGAAR